MNIQEKQSFRTIHFHWISGSVWGRIFSLENFVRTVPERHGCGIDSVPFRFLHARPWINHYSFVDFLLLSAISRFLGRMKPLDVNWAEDCGKTDTMMCVVGCLLQMIRLLLILLEYMFRWTKVGWKYSDGVRMVSLVNEWCSFIIQTRLYIFRVKILNFRLHF